MFTQPLVNTSDASSHMALWESQARKIRLSVFNMIVRGNASHLACCFSIIDILTVLYHSVLDVGPIEKGVYPRDLFILSKGHAAAALYGTLASVGLIPEKDLETFYKNNSLLAGHPMRNAYPGIEASTGSLGHGLPLAVGYARALKDDGHLHKVFTLLGDGECQEGSVWEAVEAAVRLKLSNLTVIVDANGFQGLDKTHDISPGSLEQKMKAFGAEVLNVEGHDYNALFEAFTAPQKSFRVVIATTLKGKGIDFMEGKLEWHYKVPQGELYRQALAQLE